MCIHVHVCVTTHMWRPEGKLRCQLSPSSLFIAVCSGLADLLVTGDSSVPTSPLGGVLVAQYSPRFSLVLWIHAPGLSVHGECSIH